MKRHFLAVLALFLGLATQAHAGVVWTLQSVQLLSGSYDRILHLRRNHGHVFGLVDQHAG
ncbi:MAG: hypothetical protein SGI92_31360 [Bryobacteraceae bacterium]|nr:hypothetical protein [Bryobacteraceae bacterium]